jgi:hypothetical protein
MELRYHTPEELVEALQTRGPGARAQLRQVLHEPVERLMAELIHRHKLDEDLAVITLHALHSVETALRLRPAASFRGMGWKSFRAAVLLQLAKIVYQPHGGSGPGAAQGGLPHSPAYHSDAFSRPYTRLGNHFFGGDWYAGQTHEGTGTLWVIVADVTGHGYFAYLLASGLPGIWQRCWNAHPDQPPQPADLLAAMHEILSDCLPEGIFLECTLVRLDDAGRATISPAGGSRLLIHREHRPPSLVKLRGAWLGLRAPTVEEQYTLELDLHDELILATDGVFDQLDEHDVCELTSAPLAAQATLFEVLRDRLEACLRVAPQKDDITLVLLRRRETIDGLPCVVLPLSGGAHGRSGGEDVPV